MLRKLFCTAALATMLATMVLAAVASPAAADPQPSPTGEIDLAARYLAAERGVSLAEAQRRIGWQKLAPQLAEEAAARLGDRFGGVWIDAAGQDRVRIGVLGGGSAAARASARASARSAATAVGLGEATDTVAVRHSMVELERGNAWLAAQIATVNTDAGALSTGGPGGVPTGGLTAGIRPDVNAIELQLPVLGTLTPAQSALVDEARRRLGDALRVGTYTGRATARACRYPYCDPPLRAGIRIANSGRSCTGAFIARSRVDSTLYQFTAGHCVAGGFTDTWYTHFPDGSTHAIGPRHNSRFSSGGDMAILRINNPTGWHPRAWVYVTSGPDTTADTTYHISSDGTSVVGMRICTTGAAFGRSDCGKVTQLGVTATYDGVTVTGLGRGSFCGVGGDSGAPMYASHLAYGLQVAGYSLCDSLYQGIHAAENAMNVNVLHASS
jgi:hypothetical protein